MFVGRPFDRNGADIVVGIEHFERHDGRIEGGGQEISGRTVLAQVSPRPGPRTRVIGTGRALIEPPMTLAEGAVAPNPDIERSHQAPPCARDEPGSSRVAALIVPSPNPINRRRR